MSNNLEVEEIRRRTKDNKAESGKYYNTHAFESLSQIRNLLLTLTTAGIAYFQTVDKSSIANPKLLIWSFIVGIVSYICFYIAMMVEASYYSKIEKLFSVSNIDAEQYNKLIGIELDERKNHKNVWFMVSFLLLLAQSVLIVLFFTCL